MNFLRRKKICTGQNIAKSTQQASRLYKQLTNIHHKSKLNISRAQWLSGRVLDSRPRGRGFEPHRHHCVVSLSQNINPSLVLVQPRKTRPFITERLLMGRKESNQTNKQNKLNFSVCKELGIHSKDPVFMNNVVGHIVPLFVNLLLSNQLIEINYSICLCCLILPTF